MDIEQDTYWQETTNLFTGTFSSFRNNGEPLPVPVHAKIHRSIEEYHDREAEIVIRLISWRISAMINAYDWLEKRIETIFDENLCHIMCLCHCSSSIWHHLQKGQWSQNARISGRIDAFVDVLQVLGCWKRLRKGLHSQVQTLAFLPYIMRKPQKREPNR